MVFRFFLASILILGQVRAMGQTYSQFQPPTSAHHIPNRIDSLTDSAAVLAFVQSLPQMKRRDLHNQIRLTKGNFVTNAYILRDRQQKDSFGQRQFEKADLDGNGFTDLLWNGFGDMGSMSLLVLSFGKDSFLVRELPKEYYKEFFAARIIPIDGQTMIQTWTVVGATHPVTRMDTLQLVCTLPFERLHPHPIPHLDTLGFFGLQGFSAKGSFQLTIVGDSVKMIKDRDMYPTTPVDSGGTFVTKMDSATAFRLKTIVESIDWEKIKDNYETGVVDQPTGFLVLSYKTNQKKKVIDDGLMGTYALNSLEDLLFGMPYTQSWTSIFPKDENSYHFLDATQ